MKSKRGNPNPLLNERKAFLSWFSCILFLFKHTGSEGMTTYGTHTTPIHRYVDDLTFKFDNLDNGGCFIDVRI